MSLKPNDDRVTIKPIPAEEKTKGGLIKPIESQKTEFWEVLAIGPSSLECRNCKTHRESELKPTDIVMINENAGMFYPGEDDVDYKVIRFSDIHLFEDKQEWIARKQKK